MNSRRFVKTVLVGTVTLLVIAGGLTALIDPFFHFHKPLKNLEYPLNRGSERYLNDGIIRHFDYDAAIAGTSMMQNFKTSQFDELFGTKSIKVTLTGENYWSIDQEVRKIFDVNPDVKYIFRCLDYNMVLKNKTDYNYDNVPTYLYDDNPFNDVQYIFNKDVLLDDTLEVIKYNLQGGKSTDMDTYSEWGSLYPSGRKAVLSNYRIPQKKAEVQKEFSEKDAQNVRKNVEENVLDMVKAHPDTTFYFYTPPYSVVWWYARQCSGNLLRYFEAEKLQAEMLLEYDNVKLYSFTDMFDLTQNLDNYKDDKHYNAEISEKIIDWIYEETGLITKENYEERINKMEDFYLNQVSESSFSE